MPLAAGTRLGNYEIVGPLGAGGMGEVYRAKDTKLDREVAIKVLPAAFAQHPERLARFEREAKVLASLDHRNIASIYAVEESSDGKALVMELVKGQTLKGPVPVDTALKYAAQIASALDAAHEKGITHRDLKPANIMLTPDGTIKVLDFGLAAVTQPSQSDGEAGTNMVTLTMSPTSAGVIMGTAAYMSPEQARGQTVDRRADIWSFGVVLWELLTGKQLFGGDTVSDILASVLKEEPNLEQVPAKVRPLLRRCLEKEPKKRLQAIGDWELLLSAGEESVGSERTRRASPLPWIAAAVLAVIAAALSFVHFREAAPVAELDRFAIPAPGRSAFGNYVSVSPDGRKVVFDGIGPDGRAHLWVRPLDSLEARVVADLSNNNISFPFWSPDSRFVGFQNDNKLKKAEIAGGSSQTLCDLPSLFRGGSWSQAGVIVFGNDGGGLSQVPDAGGTPTAVTVSQIGVHVAPSFLPDGRHFVYLRFGGGSESDGIYLGSLDTVPEQQSSKRLLVTQWKPVFAPSRESSRKGYILYLREATLVAQPFDTHRMDLAGEGVPIAEQVGRSNNVQASFSASTNGVLAYKNGNRGSRHLSWYDRQGKMLDSAGQPGDYQSLALSPDGTRVAVERRDSQTGADLWLVESARTAAGTRFTFDPGRNFTPVWSPVGNRVAFMSQREGGTNLYQKLSNMGGNDEALFKSSAMKYLDDWSRDGSYLLFSSQDPKTGFDLFVLPARDRGAGNASSPSKKNDVMPEAFLATKFNETQGEFSPDGKWVVYSSDESGVREVYVRPFPPSPAAGKWQVSSGGGSQPRWSRDGKEIFYLSGRTLMAAQVSTSPVFKRDLPKALFDTAVAVPSPNLWAWDVDPSGQKFLINTQAGEDTSTPITLVLNWETLLKK